MQGVTLIELLAIVAIIATLIAMLAPSYQAQSQQTRRADAAVQLTNAAVQMQSYYVGNGYSYSGADSQIQTLQSFNANSNVVYYNLSVEITNSGAGFLLSATPTSEQAADPCGVLTLDQSGERKAEKSVDECWR